METALVLTKGEKVDLSKAAPGLTKAALGLGWDVSGTSSAYDLDASAILLGVDGKMRTDNDLVYFRHLKSEDGSIQHTGDNLTGEGDGDDETINVDLDKVPADVDQVLLVVNIYEAVNRRQNFGQVKNAFIRLYNRETKEQILKYDLSEDFSSNTDVTFGRLYRHNGAWKFEATGTGHTGGLQAYLASYKK